MTFQRTYVAGESLVYDASSNMEGGMGMAMKMMVTMKTLKVYPDGSADQEVTVSNMKSTIAGTEMDMPAQKPNTYKVDQYGAMVSMSGTPTPGNVITSMVSSALKKGIAVGETVKIDATDPKAGSHVWGTVNLVSIDHGIGTIQEDLQVSMTKATESNPMVVHGTLGYDVQHHWMVTTHMEMSNLPGIPGGGSKMTISMKLVSPKSS